MRWKKPTKPSVKIGQALQSCVLKGGPLDGHRIKNHNQTGGTLRFCMGCDQFGRYQGHNWVNE